MLFLCWTNKNWEINEVILSVVMLLSKSVSVLAVALSEEKKILTEVITLQKMQKEKKSGKS